MSDRHTLLFSRPPPPKQLPSLPNGITRYFIPTPLGPLELLASQPSPSIPRKKALLFQHGGFGFAQEWTDFMTYFTSLGYPCYAVSLRGHGSSWQPGYWKMTWWYGKSDFADDLIAAIAFVRGIEIGKRGEEGFGDGHLVLLGHSAGGGLSQYLLGMEKVKVGGLVILSGFPCFGGYSVYWNWFKLDPWFAPRYYIRDLWHSRSPLSSTTLVHNAFFAPNCPRARVESLEKGLAEYESMIWPLGMMFPFVNTKGVIRSIAEWKQGRKNLLVVVGEKDVLMTPKIMWDVRTVYKNVVKRLLPWLCQSEDKKADEQGDERTSNNDSDDENVGFEVVSDSGHHFQNDVHWEEAAEKIERFLKQL